jgi:hypothetical protein
MNSGTEIVTPTMVSERFIGQQSDGAFFCPYADSLRFELGLGSQPVSRFLSAHERAMTVLRDAFRGARHLHVAVQIWHDTPTPGVAILLDACRSLRDCGLPWPIKEGIETSLVPREIDVWHTVMVMPLENEALPRAIWAAVARNMGVEPRIAAWIFVFSIDLGIMAHLYDDRGMDVAGPNMARLKELYVTHRSLLLEYDMERMRSTFEDWQPSEAKPDEG